ncbi:swr complex subunit [Claviceps sp. LM77 group G4]|nr:swr complex subunit [Claviceps sp. LM77 group G4]KAG6052568.1 swr complex subunit [Claviceps sp. LM78 group G4]KAG6067513.1 swr complex subunit [Claviceps sp. LM84 group G4]
MPPDPLADDDEQYASSQDSDFAPDAAPEAASDASDSEDATVDGPLKRKHAEAVAGPSDREDHGYDNSGDEAIIGKGRKRRRRAQERGQLVDEDEEGGPGGLVKTRAQRAAEKEERKYTVNNEPVTIDVDALWAQMISGKSAIPSKPSQVTPPTDEIDSAVAQVVSDTRAAPSTEAAPSDMIRIKRTYNFAGKVHTEEKIVARDSAEAKLYLATRQGKEAPPADSDTSTTKRTAKKAFRSVFEPSLDLGPGRTDLNLGLAARMQAGREAQAKKLTTVEKSRMDWAGYVDKEGLQDELVLASKSKDSYAARQDFLARSEAIREDDARKARQSTRV